MTMLMKSKSAITAGVLTTAFAVGSLIFGASASAAQFNCRRVLNERCSQTFRVDAGKASHTSQGKKEEINEVTVPSGFVVVNFREIDDSGNSGGGTFNVDYAARGAAYNTVRNYASESSRISNYKAKVDALYQGSQGSEKAKLDILRNQLNELSSASSAASSVETNTDIFTLRATSQYQCTNMVFGECLDGKGGHGKGRIIVEVIYVGDPSTKLNSIETQLAQLETPQPALLVNGGGKCLDAHAPDHRQNGGRVQVWDCGDGSQSQQQWTLRGNALVNGGGKCLDVHSPDIDKNGAKVQVWDCNGAPQQQWTWR